VRDHPVATTGSTVVHNRIMRRPHRTLERGLEGRTREPFGPDVKIVVDGRVRYPDAVLSCVPQSDTAQVIESTSRTDLIWKVREYQGATEFERVDETWTASTLAEGDRLRMPEIAVEITLAELHTNTPHRAAEGLSR
jgi:hypothetical protein